MKKIKNVFLIILSIALFAFLAIGLVFIYKFTNGLQEDFKSYYLEYNGNEIVSDIYDMKFNTSSNEFVIKNTLGKLQKDVEYTVTVKANSNVRFDYYVGDEKYSWQDSDLDFTEYFIQLTDNGFVVYPTVKNITELMSSIYPDNEVKLPSQLDTSFYPFEIVVSSANMNTEYKIQFCFDEFFVLDRHSIIF